MSFRVKLRITSMRVDPYRRPAPSGPVSIPKMTDPELLRRLYEAAKQATPHPAEEWHRRWVPTPGPGLPDPRLNPTCTMSVPPGTNWISWNGGVQ